jgi:uncharacterized membrane protein YkvA (DUF1232 family)
LGSPRSNFDLARRQAEEYSNDRSRVGTLLSGAERKAERDRDRLGEIWDTLGALIRLLRAWARGRYTVVPWRTLVFAIAGVLYFVDPLDLIPDPIPVIGYLDDATVLAFVLRAIRKDVERFLAWERGSLPG